jgi:F-type H+-transporting ATPase subunit delta
MVNTKAGSRYAKALVELAVENNKQARIDEDMTYLSKVCSENKEFRQLLVTPIVNVDKKLKVFNELFHTFDELSTAFIRLITKNRRESILWEIASSYSAQLKELNGIRTVTITSVKPLEDKTKQAILDKVQKSLPGKTLKVEENIDESLIGGFIVRMGDIQVDASVAHQLANMKQRLTK